MLFDRRLILVAGKGGVGRSTVAAAIASAAANRGRRTLLFQSNANDRYSTLFDCPPIGDEIVRVRPNLYAVNTSPAKALEEYGLMVLRFKRVYRMVFENRVTKYFLRAIPGLDDYSILGKAWFHTTAQTRGKNEWDTVVFDLPASGHCVSMLRIPWVIDETVPEGPLTRDARTMKALLTDPARTALVLVTLAEEMPANEATELAQTLEREFGINIASLLVNQIYPDHFPAGSPEAHAVDTAATSAVGSNLEAALGHARLARARRSLNNEYITRLGNTVRAPMTLLPRLFAPILGPVELDTLRTQLETAFADAADS